MKEISRYFKLKPNLLTLYRLADGNEKYHRMHTDTLDELTWIVAGLNGAVGDLNKILRNIYRSTPAKKNRRVNEQLLLITKGELETTIWQLLRWMTFLMAFNRDNLMEALRKAVEKEAKIASVSGNIITKDKEKLREIMDTYGGDKIFGSYLKRQNHDRPRQQFKIGE